MQKAVTIMSQIRLTYGVFLSLILEARLPREAIKKDHWTGKTDGLSDIDIFGEWMKLYSPNYAVSTTNKTFVSKLKNCSGSSTGCYPLYDTTLVNIFVTQLKSNNKITEIHDFVANNIDENKFSSFASTLFYVIKEDVEINDLYYNSSIINKNELISKKEIFIEDLIGSVLYYLATNKLKNELGKDTLKELFDFNDKNTPGQFKGNHINDFDVKVSSKCISKEEVKDAPNDNQANEMETEIIIEPEDSSNGTISDDAKTVNQRIINLHDKSKYFENVGTLILKDDDDE